jgi:WXG100 family type VII secretion target
MLLIVVRHPKCVVAGKVTWMAAVSGSGGDRLRIETNPVLAAANEFRAIAEDLRNGLQQLISSANEVVDGSWRGEAAKAFNREWDEFHRAANAVVEDADNIADLVAYSAKTYDSQDESSAAVLRSVWSGR